MEGSTSGESVSSTQAPARGERVNISQRNCLRHDLEMKINQCPQRTRGSRQKAVDNLSKKFLRNFDPEHSEREKRKLYRRLYHSHRKHLYDEKGTFIQTSSDLCDCLSLECPGCHFPCPKCSSPKCSHECRYFDKSFHIEWKPGFFCREIIHFRVGRLPSGIIANGPMILFIAKELILW